MESNGRRSEPRPATPRQRDESGGQGSGPAAGSWLVVAASQAGSSHLRRGEPCADRFEITLAAGALILAVADGAGSAARGAEGAALAARTAARLAAASLIGAPPPLEEAARHELVRDVLRQTVAAVQEEIGRLTGGCRSPMPDAPRLAAAAAAAETPAPERASCAADFLSTLLLAVLTETSLMVGNIGDGWLVTRDRQGALRAAAPPRRGEYVNETFFLTSEGALDDAVIAVVPAAELDAVALMSDGSAWFAIDLRHGAPSGPLFAKLFAFAGDSTASGEEQDRALAAFLAQPAICRKTDDDRTLILVVRPGAAAAESADDVR